MPHLGRSLKDSELLRVGQRSIKRHHRHLRAAIREVLGNVSTGFGHRFNLFLTSQKHEDVLRGGCFLEPEEKASEKLQQIGEGGRTEVVLTASLPRWPESRSLKHVQKKDTECVSCGSALRSQRIHQRRREQHFAGFCLNRMEESLIFMYLFH